MVPYVVSNVSEWSAFFDTLLDLCKKTKASAYKDLAVDWNVKLINTATTTSKGGSQFNYFQAVDTGRAPIDRGPGKYVILVGNDGGRRTRKRVAGFAGHQITTKSLGAIIPNFHNQLVEDLNLWLDSASEDELLAHGFSPSLGRFTGSARLPGFRNFRVSRTEHHAFNEDLSNFQVNEKGRAIRSSKRSESGGGGGFDDADAWLAGSGVLFKGGSAFTIKDVSVPLIPESNLTSLSTGQSDRLASRQGAAVQSAARGYKKIKAQLLAKSKANFNDKEMIGKATLAAKQAGLKHRQQVLAIEEAARQQLVKAQAGFAAEQSRLLAIQSSKAATQSFRLVSDSIPASYRLPAGVTTDPFSAEAIGGGIGPGALSAAQLLFFRKLSRVPNWYAIAAMFVDTVGNQIDEFKANTPSRAETGRFKVVSAGGTHTVLGPATGGSLRNSYVLLDNTGLEHLISGS